MDFKLTEEERLIRNTAARFVQRELLPREGAYLKQPELFLPPGAPPRRALDPETKEMLTRRAKQAGLWALELSDSEDSSPLTAVARVLIHREFGRTILPFQPPCIPGLMRMSQNAKELAEGKITLTLAFDQIHNTGNLRAISSYFREVPDGYLLSATSIDVLNPSVDLFLFPAKEERTERAGVFLLDRNTVGFSVGDEIDLTTDETVAYLTLRECKVQSDRLLGYEYEIGEMIAVEQLRIAARSLGMGMRCLADSIEHARNRVTFGRPLAQRQAIQWMLADLSVNLRSCTWITLEAAWRADQGLTYFDVAALAKKRSTQMAFEAADTAIQIHGGYGVCKEFPFEGFYREARMMRLLYGREDGLNRAIGERFLTR
jgi:acyl-CoA dehydrogenase